MKTQYYTAASLDGFVADPNHSLDWLFQFGEPEGGGSYAAFIRDVGALAMGSSTYEWVLEHHVHADPEAPKPWPYELPTWVFSSRSLPAVAGGADLRYVSGDVRPVHAAMVEAAGGRNVWIVGGGDLAGQFHDHGLLDELIVTIASVTLGAGAPLLPRRIVTPPLRLASAQAMGPGFVELRYQVGAGRPASTTAG
jgi:dihydrofolate reductase